MAAIPCMVCGVPVGPGERLCETCDAVVHVPISVQLASKLEMVDSRLGSAKTDAIIDRMLGWSISDVPSRTLHMKSDAP